MDEDFERTLLQLPQAHLFKIPARKSAEGHRAADWPKDHIWAGKLKITAKGRTAYISLIDDKNQVFAVCPVTDEGAVEKCLDSGRYFVLRIKSPQGKQAYIGMAFNERNDAFDFNVALAEHKAECEREDRAAAGIVDTPQAPLRDLTIKEGQKITVNIAGSAKKEKKPVTGGGFKLAPPPGGKVGLLAPPPADAATHHVFTGTTASVASHHATAAPAATSTTSSNDWGDLDGFGSMSFASAPAAAKKSDGFGSDPFGSSSDPFATNSFTQQSTSSQRTNASASHSTNLLDF